MEPTRPTAPAREALLRAATEELAEKGHASVSLRAVARRAGLSHAAPAHFFGDRAGMLTAVATDGFTALATALRGASSQASTGSPLAALGLAYVDFGLAHPALVDLMFRRSELVPDDPALLAAQRGALGLLRDAVLDVAGSDAEDWSLISWAVVHGLVSLVHEGVLSRITERGPEATAELARDLVVRYASGIRGASGS